MNASERLTEAQVKRALDAHRHDPLLRWLDKLIAEIEERERLALESVVVERNLHFFAVFPLSFDPFNVRWRTFAEKDDGRKLSFFRGQRAERILHLAACRVVSRLSMSVPRAAAHDAANRLERASGAPPALVVSRARGPAAVAA